MSYVQEVGFNGQTSPGISLVVPVTNAPSSANTVLVVVRSGNGQTPTSIVDTKGNTWVRDGNITNSGASAQQVYRTQMDVAVLTTSDTITLTYSGSNSADAVAVEYSGKLTAVDQSSTAKNTTSVKSVTVSAPATLASASDIVISFLCISGTVAQANPTVNNSYTLQNPPSGGHGTGLNNVAVADIQPTSTTVAGITWTWTTATANCCASVVAYTATTGVSAAGASTMQSSTSLTSTASVAAQANAAMSSATSLASVPTTTEQAAATMASSTELSDAANLIEQATAAMSSSTQLSDSATLIEQATAAMSSSTSLTALLTEGLAATASMSSATSLATAAGLGFAQFALMQSATTLSTMATVVPGTGGPSLMSMMIANHTLVNTFIDKMNPDGTLTRQIITPL